MNIREMLREDIPACADILCSVYNNDMWQCRWTKKTAMEYLTDFFETKKFVGYVLEENGEILGGIFAREKVWWNNSEVFIEEMFVKPELQRRGCGTLLLQAVETYVKEKGLAGLTLETNKYAPAPNFYNSAVLEYSNDPDNESLTDNTPAQEVKVHSFNVKIHKIDENDKTNLANAKFVLYKKEAGTDTPMYYYYNKNTKAVEWKKLGEGGVAGTLEEELAKEQPSITEVTTNADGNASFQGIAADDYFLQETKAPEGYNLLQDPKPVTITKEPDKGYPGKVYSVTVENSSGTLLPGTGGIGNTIFYIVGGALILAGVVLLMRKRAK